MILAGEVFIVGYVGVGDGVIFLCNYFTCYEFNYVFIASRHSYRFSKPAPKALMRQDTLILKAKAKNRLLSNSLFKKRISCS